MDDAPEHSIHSLLLPLEQSPAWLLGAGSFTSQSWAVGTENWQAAAMAPCSHPWEVGKPKLGAAQQGRVEGSGLCESPQQGREVKRALESPVTGRQAGLLCVPVPAWVAPHWQALIADGAAVSPPHMSPIWLRVPSSPR